MTCAKVKIVQICSRTLCVLSQEGFVSLASVSGMTEGRFAPMQAPVERQGVAGGAPGERGDGAFVEPVPAVGHRGPQQPLPVKPAGQQCHGRVPLGPRRQAAARDLRPQPPCPLHRSVGNPSGNRPGKKT